MKLDTIKNQKSIKFPSKEDVMKNREKEQRLIKEDIIKAQQQEQKEKQLEQRKQQLQQKKQALQQKKQEQLEMQKTKAEIRKLKSETSVTGRLYRGTKTTIQQGRKEIKALQKLTGKKAKDGKQSIRTTKNSQYLVVNGQLYQRKGDIRIQSTKTTKKNKETGFL